MSVCDLIEREYVIDVGSNPACGNAAHDFLSPAADLFAFAPHVAQVQTKDAFVSIHQSERVEARHLGHSFQRSEFSSNTGGGSDGHAEHAHASGGAQRAI